MFKTADLIAAVSYRPMRSSIYILTSANIDKAALTTAALIQDYSIQKEHIYQLNHILL